MARYNVSANPKQSSKKTFPFCVVDGKRGHVLAMMVYESNARLLANTLNALENTVTLTLPETK